MNDVLLIEECIRLNSLTYYKVLIYLKYRRL